MKYLKKKGTPDFDYYVSTPALEELAASKGELFPYDPAKKAFIVGDNYVIDTLATTKEELAEISKGYTDSVLSPKEDYVIYNEIVRKVVEIMPSLSEKDWTKKTTNLPAMPRVDSLTEALGFDVSREERDEALRIYKAMEKA